MFIQIASLNKSRKEANTMEMMNYEMAQARIADLKALRHPRPTQATVGFSLRDTLVGWWHSIQAPASKAPAAYRAELLRQEWMVKSEPANRV